MSSKIITFDISYMQENIGMLASANNTIDEALMLLKKASAHEGWRCPEITRIEDEFSNLQTSIGNQKPIIEKIINAMREGITHFEGLEGESSTHVSSSGRAHGGGGMSFDSNVTYVPNNPNPCGTFVDALLNGLLIGPLKGGAARIPGLIKKVIDIPGKVIDKFVKRFEDMEGKSIDDIKAEFQEIAKNLSNYKLEIGIEAVEDVADVFNELVTVCTTVVGEGIRGATAELGKIFGDQVAVNGEKLANAFITYGWKKNPIVNSIQDFCSNILNGVKNISFWPA